MTHTSKTSRTPFVGLFAGLIALALASGCGPGSGQGLDENGNLPTQQGGGGTGTGASGNRNATLAWLQSNVFGGVCTQCHTGAGAPLGVDWSSESASCANVGRASGEIPTMVEIESGDPAASYMIWKVDGAGPNGETIVGARMPLSNPPLNADTLQNLRDWVADGTLGCQAQSTGLVDNPAMKSGRPGGGDSQNGSVDTPGSWMAVWRESLQICATCHSILPSNPRCMTDLQCPPNGVVLGRDNYFGVVDGDMIAPFDPDGSRLWRQITADDPHQRMPFELTPLTRRQRDIVFDWITDGAPFCPENAICPSRPPQGSP